VPHGSTKNKKTASDNNVRDIVRVVKKLAFGHGIDYVGWPEGAVFQQGVRINMKDFDFNEMLQQAKAFEATHGKDLGHGWLMRHPIQKLILYKEYLMEQQQQK
jgi:hypothetical protein